MPKISNKSFKASNDDISKHYNVEVMYNSEKLFYVVIPAEFNEQVDLLSESQMKKWHISKIPLTKRYNAEFKRIVNSTTEDDAVFKCKEAVEKMMKTAVKKRNVILIFYDEDNHCDYSGMKHNNEHPQIGLRFGLTYCVETCLGPDKKIYNLYTTHKKASWNDDEDYTTRSEVSAWNSKFTVIDDTPANRAFLEDLYTKMNLLNKQLGKITKTPEQLLKVIASNQKLIG